MESKASLTVRLAPSFHSSPWDESSVWVDILGCRKGREQWVTAAGSQNWVTGRENSNGFEYSALIERR